MVMNSLKEFCRRRWLPLFIVVVVVECDEGSEREMVENE